MNIYFGEAIDDFDTSELFQVDDKYFYYKISVSPDNELIISDTCNRYIPISVESLNSLINAINYVTPHMEFINLLDSDTNFILK